VPLACAMVARWWPRRFAAALAVMTSLVLVACAALTVLRNRDWCDEETLFRQTLAYAPPAARVWFNLANLELAAGRNDEAIRLYGEALAREPGDAAAHLNRGIAFQRQRRLDAAEADYRRALELDPGSEQARRGLAAMLAARGAVAEARRVLDGAP
jgi:protein O-mannosyl-transferase